MSVPADRLITREETPTATKGNTMSGYYDTDPNGCVAENEGEFGFRACGWDNDDTTLHNQPATFQYFADGKALAIVDDCEVCNVRHVEEFDPNN